MSSKKYSAVSRKFTAHKKEKKIFLKFPLTERNDVRIYGEFCCVEEIRFCAERKFGENFLFLSLALKREK